MRVHIESGSPVVGAERARLNFDVFNGTDRYGKGKVGVSSSVHTLDSSVWLCVCARARAHVCVYACVHSASFYSE